jgi:hypothetical protein
MHRAVKYALVALKRFDWKVMCTSSMLENHIFIYASKKWDEILHYPCTMSSRRENIVLENVVV